MFQIEMVVMAARERKTCFGTGEKDYLGLVSFGTFILIVGIVFTANPNLVSDFQLWIEQMANEQNLVRPRIGLITSAIVFFGLIGLSDFFMAGIRLWIDKSRRRVLVDILSGIALVTFAYLIYLYGSYALTWQTVVAIEVVVIGLLVIAYSTARYVFWK